jgi:hypothetical protein
VFHFSATLSLWGTLQLGCGKHLLHSLIFDFILKRRKHTDASFTRRFLVGCAIPDGVKVGESDKKAHQEAADFILFSAVQIHRLGLDICQSAVREMVVK